MAERSSSPCSGCWLPSGQDNYYPALSLFNWLCSGNNGFQWIVLVNNIFCFLGETYKTKSEGVPYTTPRGREQGGEGELTEEPWQQALLRLIMGKGQSCSESASRAIASSCLERPHHSIPDFLSAPDRNSLPCCREVDLWCKPDCSLSSGEAVLAFWGWISRMRAD